MSVKLRLNTATATRLVLAKIGNPQREEPLQTSREVFEIAEPDQTALTAIFLKPFKNLMAHRFTHHSSLDKHEMNICAKALFADGDDLLKHGCEISPYLSDESRSLLNNIRKEEKHEALILGWRTNLNMDVASVIAKFL